MLGKPMLNITRADGTYTLSVPGTFSYVLTPDDLQVLEAIMFPGYVTIPELRRQVMNLTEHRDDLRHMLSAVMRGSATVTRGADDAGPRTES